MQLNSSLPDIPTHIDTVEKLLVWALEALAYANYSPIEISVSSGPIAPISLRVARAPSGPNYGKAYLEFGGYLELENESLFSGPLSLSALPYDSAATVASLPARFAA